MDTSHHIEGAAPARLSAAPLGQGNVRALLYGGLFIAVLLAGVVAALWNLRANTLDDARRATSELGRALAEQSSRSLQAVDL